MFSLLVVFTFHACGAVSMPFFHFYSQGSELVRRPVCSLFCLCCSKLVVFESRLCGGKLVVLLPVWQQACSFVACVAVNLLFLNLACVAVSLQFCCLCGCKVVVLYYACGAASLQFVLCLCGSKLVVCIMPVWQQACSFVLRLCGGEKEKKDKKKFCCLCGCKLKACCFLYACGAARLQFVLLYLCGSKLVVLYYACVAAKKEKKKKKAKKKFCCLCGCKLKACCFVLRLWGGKLVVLCYACVVASLQFCCVCGGKPVVLSCLYGVKLVFHLKKKQAASFVLFYACVVVTFSIRSLLILKLLSSFLAFVCLRSVFVLSSQIRMRSAILQQLKDLKSHEGTVSRLCACVSCDSS